MSTIFYVQQLSASLGQAARTLDNLRFCCHVVAETTATYSPPPSLGNPGNTRNMQVAGPFGCTTSRRYETMWRRTLVGRECRTMPGKATAGYSTTSCEGQPDPRPHTANTLAIFEAVTHLVPRRHLPTPPGQGTELLGGARDQSTAGIDAGVHKCFIVQHGLAAGPSMAAFQCMPRTHKKRA